MVPFGYFDGRGRDHVHVDELAQLCKSDLCSVDITNEAKTILLGSFPLRLSYLVVECGPGYLGQFASTVAAACPEDHRSSVLDKTTIRYVGIVLRSTFGIARNEYNKPI